MKLFYLIKPIPIDDERVMDAEQYLKKEFELNHSILESLLRIKQFLYNATLDQNGLIEQLTLKIKNGSRYYSYRDEYIDPFTGQSIKYEIIKKLTSQPHVYEIRFVSHVNNQNRNCRVIFTINKSKVYIILTHGFTKLRTDNHKLANKLTNELAQIAEIIFNNINNYNDVEYIGKGDNRHEFQY